MRELINYNSLIDPTSATALDPRLALLTVPHLLTPTITAPLFCVQLLRDTPCPFLALSRCRLAALPGGQPWREEYMVEVNPPSLPLSTFDFRGKLDKELKTGVMT